MKRTASVTLAIALLSWPLSSTADIYAWTDPQGIVHLTNVNPPAHAEIMLETREIHSRQAPGEAPNADDHKKRLMTHKENYEIPLSESAPNKAQRTEQRSRPVQTALPTDELLVAAGSNGTHRHAIRYRKIYPNRHAHRDHGYERHRYRKEHRYHRYYERRRFHRDQPLRYQKPSRYYMRQGYLHRDRHHIPGSRHHGIDRGRLHRYHRW